MLRWDPWPVLVALALLSCFGKALVGMTGLTRSLRACAWKTPGFDTPRYFWDKQDKRHEQGSEDSSPDDTG